MKRYAVITTSILLALGMAWFAVAAGQWMITRESQPEYYFYGVSFADKKHGWAVGESIFDFEGDPGKGVVAYTSDGGSSWKIQESPAEYIISAVDFVNAKVGFVAGDRGMVMTTKDGGKSWSPSVTGTDNWLYDVSFVDETHGWAVGMGETVVVTTNGRTWKILQGGAAAAGVGDEDMIVYNGVHFINEKTGWAAGLKLVQGAGQEAYVVRTDDGGKTWTHQPTGQEDTLQDIYFIDENHGWTVGQYGMILATADGGATWKSQTSPTEEDLQAICFADAKHGWASGKYGSGQSTLLETSDGGETWSMVTVAVKRALEGIDASDAGNAWVVGDGGVVIRYAE